MHRRMKITIRGEERASFLKVMEREGNYSSRVHVSILKKSILKKNFVRLLIIDCDLARANARLLSIGRPLTMCTWQWKPGQITPHEDHKSFADYTGKSHTTL